MVQCPTVMGPSLYKRTSNLHLVASILLPENARFSTVKKLCQQNKPIVTFKVHYLTWKMFVHSKLTKNIHRMTNLIYLPGPQTDQLGPQPTSIAIHLVGMSPGKRKNQAVGLWNNIEHSSQYSTYACCQSRRNMQWCQPT